MSGRSKQSLRGLTLAVLIPCLLFSAVLSAWITYRDLYNVILNGGFEQKLDAISTGVAAFINGNAHLALSEPTRLTGLAADPSKPVLWGLDSAQSRLVTIDMVHGGATRLDTLPGEGLTGLVYDAPQRRLIATRPSTGALYAFTPTSPAPRLVARIRAGAYALALDSSATRLVAAGPWGLRAYRLPPLVHIRARPRLAPIWSTAAVAQAIAVSPDDGSLLALEPGGDLYRADSVGAPLRKLGKLEGSGDGADSSQLGTVRALTVNPVTSTAWGAGERLTAITPDDLTFAVARFRRGYRNANSPTYLKYVVPMRLIRDALNVTYLYTQDLVPGEDSIEYVIDSTPLGPDYSPIGSREYLNLQADVRGMTDLMEQGVVYSSGIEWAPDWGMLKSAFAPILTSEGRPVGMVGTDISVSTIRDRTQVALAKVGLVTVVILFLGGLASIAISIRLTGPLSAVQEGATRVAAGRASEPIEPPRLRDLTALTTSFNEMTDTLTSLVSDLKDETRRVESMRTRRHLVRELLGRDAEAGTLPDDVSVGWSGPQSEPPAWAGRLEVGDPERPLTVVWVHPARADESDSLSSLAERKELAHLARSLARTTGATAESLAAGLDRFWAQERAVFAVVDPTESLVVPSVFSHFHAVVKKREDEPGESVSPAPGRAFRVPVGSELAVLVADGVDGASEGAPERTGWLVRVRGTSA